MKYLILLATKYIKRQKFRTLLTFISITLAAFIMTIGLISLSSILASLKQQVINEEGTWEVNLIDYVDEENIPDAFEKLKNHILVSDILYQDSRCIEIPYSEKDGYIEVSYDNKGKFQCRSVTQNTISGNNELIPDEGIRIDPVSGDNGIILPDKFKEYGYSQGDNITLSFKYIVNGYSEQPYTDSFIIEGFSNTSPLQTKYLKISANLRKNIVKGIAENNINSQYPLSEYSDSDLYIRVNKMGDFEDCINKILGDIGSNKKYTDLLSDSSSFNSQLLLFELKALINPQYISAIFGILASLLFLFWLIERFIIDNAFEISVAERNRKFTTLKTLGASKAQLKALTFSEAAFYCLTAVPFGIIIAYIIVTVLFNSFAHAGIQSMVLSAHPVVFAADFLLCVISVVISSYTSALWNTRKSTLIKAMNYGNSVKLKKPRKKNENHLNKSPGKFIKTYCKRNIQRAKGKFIFSAFAGSVSMILLISTLFSTIEIKRQIEKAGGMSSLERYPDFSIYVSNEQPANLLKYFEKGKDIVECRVSSSDIINIHTDSEIQMLARFSERLQEALEIQKQIDVLTIDRAAYDKNMRDIVCLSYDQLVDSGGAILKVSVDCEEECFKPVSEYGFLSEPEIEFGDHKFKIIGATNKDAWGVAHLVIPVENASDITFANCEAMIYANDSDIYKQASEFCEEFVRTNSNVYYYEDEFMEGTGIKNTLSAIAKTAIVFFVFTWLTGMVSMINLTNTRIMNCQKEYFILRCIGMSKRQMLRTILYDVVYFSVLSTTIGFLIGNSVCFMFISSIQVIDVKVLLRDAALIGIPAFIGSIIINIAIPVLFARPLIKKMYDTSSEVVNSNDMR